MPTLNRNVIDMGQTALLTHLIRLTPDDVCCYSNSLTNHAFCWRSHIRVSTEASRTQVQSGLGGMFLPKCQR
jgi:hypothetical protein